MILTGIGMKFPKIGKGSALFTPGSNTYLSASGSSDWAVGTGDYTIEWWQYQTNNENENFISSLGTGNTFATAMASGGGRLNLYSGGSRIANPVITGSVLNTWTAFAISRSSGTTRLFQNGTQIGSNISDSSNITDSSSSYYIGVNDPSGSTNDNFPGYLTNFRFTKGSALYTSNYSISTIPLSPGPNTKLLLLTSSTSTLTLDSSGTSKVITNNNSVSWNALTPF